MTVIKLTEQYLDAFKEYCQVHRYEHDESYLYEEDMDEFELGTGKHPTWLLLEGDSIMGTLSLLLDDYFFNAGKARVRIFHCVSGEAKDYRMLFDAIDGLPRAIREIEIFLPEALAKIIATMKDFGFTYFRTAYIMVRKDQPALEPEFPEGYSLRTLVAGQDDAYYAKIRNIAFQKLKGSETPLTDEQVIKLTTGDELLKDGIQLLCDNGEPIGLVRMELEDGPDGKFGFVAPLALLPEYQGKALGTQLLKTGIAIAQKNDLPNTMLCVNAENQQALGLYKKVGFVVDESMSCLQYAVQ